MAKATAEQLKLINKFAKEPLTEENALVHGFRLIGTRLITDRFLKIDKSLLDIYLQDIKNGDVVQIADHSMGRFFSGTITLPFGRFFDGKLTEEGGETHLAGDPTPSGLEAESPRDHQVEDEEELVLEREDDALADALDADDALPDGARGRRFDRP